MSRFEAISLAVVAVSLLGMPLQSQEPRSSIREYVTMEGTVERADPFSRALTLRMSQSSGARLKMKL